MLLKISAAVFTLLLINISAFAFPGTPAPPQKASGKSKPTPSKPALLLVPTLTPAESSLIGGTTTKIVLTLANAPKVAQKIKLISSSPLLTIPDEVTINAGTTRVDFVATTKATSFPEIGQITAICGNAKATNGIRIDPDSPLDRGPWPCAGGDLFQTGRTLGSIQLAGVPVWKCAFADGTQVGQSTPSSIKDIVVDHASVVYVLAVDPSKDEDQIDYRDTVFAIDSLTGKVLWKLPLSSKKSDYPNAGSLLIGKNGTLFVGPIDISTKFSFNRSQIETDPMVVAVDTNTHAILWKTIIAKPGPYYDGVGFEIPREQEPPRTVGGMTIDLAGNIVVAYSRRVLSLEGKTGKVRWRTDSKDYKHPPRVLPNGKICLQTESLIIIDPDTGQEIWQKTPEKGDLESPIRIGSDNVLYFAVRSRNKGIFIYALDVASGNERWHFFDDRGNEQVDCFALLADNNLILCEYPFLIKIDHVTGKNLVETTNHQLRVDSILSGANTFASLLGDDSIMRRTMYSLDLTPLTDPDKTINSVNPGTQYDRGYMRYACTNQGLFLIFDGTQLFAIR